MNGVRQNRNRDAVCHLIEAPFTLELGRLVQGRQSWVLSQFEMRNLKNWVKGVGIVTVLVGLMALPLGMGVSPKRDTSFFSNLADTGMFVTYGLTLILVGIVALIVSAFLPTHDENGG